MAASGFTIYTLGDTVTFESMLQGVALIFQDGFFNGGGAFGLGNGVYLGALILLGLALYQSAINNKFDIKGLIIPLIVYVILTMPKTEVILVDVYNQEPPKIVSGIPLGLALPLNLMGGLSYAFTDSMETAYSTPNSPRLLTDGFASPLKQLHSLRYVNISEESTYISNMMNKVYHHCVLNNAAFDPNEYKNSPDSYTYFLNFLRRDAKGIVPIKDIHGATTAESCYSSADKLQSAFEAFVNGDGTENGSLNYNFKRSLNSALMLSGNIGLQQDVSGDELIDSFVQMTDLGYEDGRKFMLNTLFNQPLQTAALCSNSIGSTEKSLASMGSCVTWMQSEEQLTEDNAAAATGFVAIMQDGQNILLILAILLFPFVVTFIMFMGLKSMAVISSYLMFIASVYLWMPMAAIVNFYSYSKLRNTFENMNGGDSFSLADYPTFYQAVSEALSVANGITAILPIFCMMFFSGMTMAMVGMMRRMDVTQSGHFDAKVNAPDAISASPFAKRNSLSSSNGLGAVTDKEGGKAFTGVSTTTFQATATEMMALQRQKQLLEKKTQSLTNQVSESERLAVSGEDKNTSLTDVDSKNNREVVKGQGYDESFTKTNSGRLATDKLNSTIEAKQSNVITLTDSSAVQTVLGGSLKVGQGSVLSEGMPLNNDGSPITDLTNIQPTTNVPMDGQKEFSIGIAEVKWGTGIGRQGNYQDIDKKVALNKFDQAIYVGEGKESLNLEESKYKIGGHQINQKIGNTGEENAQSVTTALSTDKGTDNTHKIALSKQLSDTQSELDQVNHKIAQMTAVSFTTNMLDSDVMNRIARHDSVKSDLSALSQVNKEKYGENWDKALEGAADRISLTGLGITKAINPEEYEYYKIVLAGMAFDYNSANSVFKALTGFDYAEKELNHDLRSKNINWDAINVDTNSIEQGRKTLLGVNFNLAGQMTYLAGTLNVEGDKQQRNMIMVYNSFLNAGFTPQQSAILTAEVGRENSFNSSSLFGTHYDPEKTHIMNGGMISFNQSRKIALDKQMMTLGLVEHGGIGKASYVRSQESLNAMAVFMYKELSTDKSYASSWKALNSTNMNVEQIHYTVGKNYIGWRIDDPEYKAKGENNRKIFAEKLENVMQKQNKLKFEASPLAGLTGNDLIKANNPNLAQALAKTGLKGQILGNGLVDNKYIYATGLPLKTPKGNADQAYGGGKSKGYTVEFAHLVNSQMNSNIRYFSGFNDEYHQRVGSTGRHVKGEAFDLVLKNGGESEKAVANLKKLAKDFGYNIAIVNEYKSKSKDFTGDHIHVSVLGRELKQANNIQKSVNAALVNADNRLTQAGDNKYIRLSGPNKNIPSKLNDHGVGGEIKAINTNAIHAKKTKELTTEFNNQTLEKYGVTLEKGADGEVYQTIKNVSKVAKNVVTEVPLSAPSNTLETAKQILQSVVAGDPENKLHRKSSESKDGKDLPQISMYNLKREEAKAENRKTNNDEQKERIDVTVKEFGEKGVQIKKENEETVNRLSSELQERLQKERRAINPNRNPDFTNHPEYKGN